MSTASSLRLSGRTVAALCILSALALPLASLPARAQEDSFESRLVRGLFGGNDPGIEYRERSPLVLPPSTELPTPENAAKAEATPNWPKDPEAARRRAAATTGKEPAYDPFERASRPLSRDELRRGTARGQKSDEPIRTLSDAQMGRTLTPTELGEKRSLFGLIGAGAAGGEKPEKFAGEPARTRLVDPPAGYRTPESGQPYAPPKNSGGWFKSFNVFDWGTASPDR